MKNIFGPKCGSSDSRNQDFLENYSVEQYFKNMVDTVTPLIFDIGAHQGESVHFFKEIYPSSCIYSFEPNPDNFQILETVCSSYNSKSYEGYCKSINLALAEKNGVLPFYKQSLSHLGGLLPINNQSRDSLGYAEKAQNNITNVKVVKLDDFCKEFNVQFIDILKIDVQGYELYVLEGAENILKKCQYCIVEVSLYDFYQKSTTLLDVEILMNKSGLKLWDISKVSKNPKNLRTDWVELVYKNSK